MKKFLFLSLLLLSFIPISGCDDDTNTVNVLNSPTGPSGGKTIIEFRVSGNASQARIRYSNPNDGLSQVVTTLPFTTSFTTSQSTIFVSLEATPLTFPFSVLYPFNAVQIFADGNLFREASSADFLQSTIGVSGTYRK